MDETLNILCELLPPVILQHIIDQYSTWCVSSNLSKFVNYRTFYFQVILYFYLELISIFILAFKKCYFKFENMYLFAKNR